MNLCFQCFLLPELWCSSWRCLRKCRNKHSPEHAQCLRWTSFGGGQLQNKWFVSLSLPDESLLPLFLSLLEEITLSGALCLARVCPALMAVIWMAKRKTEKNGEESALTTLIPHNKNTLCHSSVFICIQISPQTNIKCGNLWAIFAHGVPGMRCERVSDVCTSLRRRAPDLPH